MAQRLLWSKAHFLVMLPHNCLRLWRSASGTRLARVLAWTEVDLLRSITCVFWKGATSPVSSGSKSASLTVPVLCIGEEATHFSLQQPRLFFLPSRTKHCAIVLVETLIRPEWAGAKKTSVVAERALKTPSPKSGPGRLVPTWSFGPKLQTPAEG